MININYKRITYSFLTTIVMCNAAILTHNNLLFSMAIPFLVCIGFGLGRLFPDTDVLQECRLKGYNQACDDITAVSKDMFSNNKEKVDGFK